MAGTKLTQIALAIRPTGRKARTVPFDGEGLISTLQFSMVGKNLTQNALTHRRSGRKARIETFNAYVVESVDSNRPIFDGKEFFDLRKKLF